MKRTPITRLGAPAARRATNAAFGALTFSLGLALGACGRTDIAAENYDTSCNVDDDCVPIAAGPACECLTDMGGTINRGDLERYHRDLEAREAEFCLKPLGCDLARIQRPIACVDGTCAFTDGDNGDTEAPPP